MKNAPNESKPVEVREIKSIDREELIKLKAHKGGDGNPEELHHIAAILNYIDREHVRPHTTNHKGVENHNEEKDRPGSVPAKFPQELADQDEVLARCAANDDGDSARRQIADVAFEHEGSVFKHRDYVVEYLGVGC